MSPKERNLVILNNVIIAILIAIRIMFMGMFLLVYGLFAVLPITIFHIIVSNRGFKVYSKLSDKGKLTAYASFFLFIIFILCQYETAGMIEGPVIQILLNRLFEGLNCNMNNLPLSTISITLISALMLIAVDIYLTVQIDRIKNGST